MGITGQIRDQMARDGLDEAEAKRQVWIVDLPGLLSDGSDGLLDYHWSYARSAAEAVSQARTANRAPIIFMAAWLQIPGPRRADYVFCVRGRLMDGRHGHPST